MKNFLIIFLIGFTTFLSAPECEYQVNEVDKFTGNQKKITQWEKVIAKMSFTMVVTGKELDGDKYFMFDAYTAGIFAMNEGNRIIFLDNEDNPYTFTCFKDVIADYTTVAGVTQWSGRILANYSGDLNELLDKKMVSLRVYFNDGYIQYDVKSKKLQKGLSEVVKCLI